MVYIESETVELKEIVVDDIKKEIIAFANTKGGRIYVGVDNNGNAVGVDNPDDEMLKITNMVRDAIKPDITMFLSYQTFEDNGKQIIEISVQRGTGRPYYLAKKGLRPEGVYVRQGTSSVPATDTAIRQMIKETDGDSFEEMRSLEQSLTFEQTGKEFEIRSIPFGDKQKQTLHLATTEGVFTNLGLLLSDQCVHTIKLAVFEGIDQTNFKDRHEFEGSLLKQLNDVYEMIDFRNSTHAVFNKLLRTDIRDYPEEALREALLNMLVHRDYSFRASSNISIYADRIEFISLGGLLPGVSLADVMLGLSLCRNPNLANVFYRLQLIEAYGTGIQKIMNSYKYQERKPEIEVTDNAFKITLPNINFAPAQTESVSHVAPLSREVRKNNAEDTIIRYLQEHGETNRGTIENLLGISTATAYRFLKRLVQKGIILQEKRGKDTVYRIL